MDANTYCRIVEKKYRQQKDRYENFPIRKNDSSLISLKKSDFTLLYEPSFLKGYSFLVRKAVYNKIGRISKRLSMENKVLIIRSAWRSFRHQEIIWANFFKFTQAKHPKKSNESIAELIKKFVAPAKESMHSTGGAIDALIYDLKKECVLTFGTNNGYKINLNRRCYPLHPSISSEAKKNRKLLIGLFEEENFVCDSKEFWHFDYGNIHWAIEKGKKESLYSPIGSKKNMTKD